MRVHDDAVAKLLPDLGKALRACMLTTQELSKLARVPSRRLLLAESHGIDFLEPSERKRVAQALVTFILSRRRTLAELVPERGRQQARKI